MDKQEVDKDENKLKEILLSHYPSLSEKRATKQEEHFDKDLAKTHLLPVNRFLPTSLIIEAKNR
jgi:hypothetical protein